MGFDRQVVVDSPDGGNQQCNKPMDSQLRSQRRENAEDASERDEFIQMHGSAVEVQLMKARVRSDI